MAGEVNYGVMRCVCYQLSDFFDGFFKPGLVNHRVEVGSDIEGVWPQLEKSLNRNTLSSFSKEIAVVR